MKSVNFQFDIDQEVIIKLTGEPCLVTMLGVDEIGPLYVCKGKDSNHWWKESQIEAA